MDKIIHTELVAKIDQLKKVTKDLALEDLVNFVWMQQHKFNTSQVNGKHLSSPLRQGMYLLGIASAQKEPVDSKIINKGKCDLLISLLNTIFSKYAQAYFPSKSELINGLDENWHRHREIAMPAFIQYFCSGFSISTDKIKDWIKFYFDGFDQKIESKFGSSHNDFLAIGDFLEKKISENLDGVNSAISLIKTSHENFKAALESGADHDEELEKLRSDESLQAAMASFLEGTNKACSIDIEEIRGKFGEDLTNSLLNNFTIQRGSAKDITYITDENPVQNKPLLTVDGKNIYFLLNNSFYQSIINNLELELSSGKGSQKFYIARDKRLEEHTCNQFKKLFNGQSILLESAYETDDSHYEHDLIIIDQRSLYIIEAKASPPREPLRDPTKAYQKIRDHFRSKTGIQKAFGQANDLKNKLFNIGKVDLFDQKGNLLHQLKSDDFDDVFCICVTRDDFGALAANLNLLLDKEDKDSYPWVVSIADLECLIDGWSHLGLGKNEFNSFLEDRVKLHGKVYGTDELEYAGAFLKYGGFKEYIKIEADLIPLDISESDIFDEIFFCEKRGEKYQLKPIKLDLVKFDRQSFLNKTKTTSVKKNNKKNKNKLQKNLER